MDRPIQGFEGCTVNEHGEVKINDKPAKAVLNGRGYLKVFLPTGDGKRTSRPIHRLVACAFLDNTERLPVVNHIDGNKHNNDVTNLEWVTHQENSRKALELKARERKPVARLTKSGKVGAVFLSIAAAAKYYDCSYRSLFEAVKNGAPYKGHLWRHCRVDITLEE